MVAIVKVNFDWKGSKRTKITDSKLVWIYNTKDESYIDLDYSGEKDAIWTSIQNSLKPLIREKVINDLFLQANS
jgi:hypothetical protein